MKKYLLLLILPFIFLSDVKADETYTLNISTYDLNKKFCGIGGCNLTLEESYAQLLNIYNTQYKTDDTAYHIDLFTNYNTTAYTLSLNYYNKNDLTFTYSSDGIGVSIPHYNFITYDDNTNNWQRYSPSGSIGNNILIGTKENYYSNQYLYFDSSWDFPVALYNYTLTGFYSQTDSISLPIGSIIPKAKDFFNYDSWSNFGNGISYTTVNLDDYEYVLLSLKDYSQKKAFSSNLQVKGQIGITPIYNYGQTAKDDVINHQITDRCNVNYSDYTDYRLYVTDTDLSNNSIYAVKSCNSGSSFKFDNSVFNITYVTSDNKNDPTITINGNTYHTIPYSNLPSTATQNEEDNYIPGASEDVITGNSVGLTSIIKNIQKGLSDIWGIFTYFMNFVNQIFSVLPSEYRTVLVASFSIGCILGVLKIFKS